jgi:tRNA dimethylallyltransferase
VLIAGPTASGKSALALEIAEAQGGVIVNADALQVYDGWRVLTARPSPEEEARAPHALYGHVPFEAEYSVGDWLREVAPLCAAAAPDHRGRHGALFPALTEGLAEIPPDPRRDPRRGRGADRPRGHAGWLAGGGPRRGADRHAEPRCACSAPGRCCAPPGRPLAAWQDETGRRFCRLRRPRRWCSTPTATG